MLFAFGDSIMKGIIANNNNNNGTNTTELRGGLIKYVITDNNFVSRIESHNGKTIRNLSRFGSTILGGLKNLDRHLREIQPGDTVVLEFGGNDCNFDWKAIAEDPYKEHKPSVTLEEFRKLYREAIEKVLSVGAKPVLLSLPAILPLRFFDFVSQGLNKDNILLWLGGDTNTIANWHEQYNLEIFKIGAEQGVPVIDISTTFLSRRGLGDCYCIDGMHPNELGHDIIAEAILTSGQLECA